MQTAPTEDSEGIDEPITQRTVAASLGEHLIPLLLLVGEVCIGYSILLSLAVSLNFAGDANSLLPFWGLLLILLSFYGVSRLFRHRAPTGVALKVIEPVTWLLLVPGFSLFFVWLNNYAQTTSLFSLQWLLAWPHDFLPTSQFVVFVLVVAISGWRGYRLVYKHFLSDDIDRFFKFGVVVLLVVIGIFLFQFDVTSASQAAYITQLSPQIPALLTATFFICMLTARALQNVSYIRHFHRAKLWGSISRQEQVIWLSMLLLGVVIITIAHFLGQAAIVISSSNNIPLSKRKGLVPGGRLSGQGGQIIHPSSAPPIGFIIALIVITLLVLGLILLFICLHLRKLQRLAKQPKKQKIREEKENSDEIHETLFSWSLLRAQLKALLLAILGSLRRKSSGEQRAGDDILLAEPAVRSIREVYRALLKKATSMGHTREKDETPYEFRQRLHEGAPLIGSELEMITEAYVLARYSGRRPGDGEISHVKAIWSALKQKWG